jgi:hypothetical protein
VGQNLWGQRRTMKVGCELGFGLKRGDILANLKFGGHTSGGLFRSFPPPLIFLFLEVAPLIVVVQLTLQWL